ncbi:MAG TPA: SDR family oxidoreductase, partial [Acidimicrobiales bacterium]|nr:SDR family oxidoreductase [Acidimicrobiales bacterium]
AIMAPDVIAKDTNPVDIDFEIWDRTFDVNVRGYLAGCKYAIPHMLKQGKGAIVNTASGSGVFGDLSSIAYGSSKAAIIGFTRYVATIYGKRGIRCNAINPGLIRSEGVKKTVSGPMVDILADNTLTPRLGQPEDIAAAVAYLVSDDAEFVTGAIINVDGGITCHAPYVSDVLRVFGEGQAFGAAENE